MDEMNINTTEYNYHNQTGFDYTDEDYDGTYYDLDYNFECPGICISKVLNLLNRITIGVGLLLILIVMIAVFSQVRKGQDAPVYVINLLVSDIFQLCSRIPANFSRLSEDDLTYIHIVYFGIMVSVGFMVCIFCERYLVITKPLWYRFKRRNKRYVVVCIVVWILPLFYIILGIGLMQSKIAIIFFMIVLLLPFPFFIFFLVGTIRALSAALGVPADEKRRIVAIQVAVLIIYTLLYLPVIILLLGAAEVFDSNSHLNSSIIVLHFVALVCVFLSPLADTTLYLFTRKTILDKFLASICSCKISNILETISTGHGSRSATTTETV
ncbi:G-protein coupled receptor 4-like [Poeciliopsis prolifica]|uniref:G-protein coupled receptor 4-like n=1 Tax=Poeciliopsis prolifica TaxID=188132 RepID=UPI002413D610|nr:G-protein coupled receptor 4-like [Poeciliopsis prolifica]XP_054877684.1 G-protein coupled receptor 4-like [Poeciliopsis prolifica]XP_054877685.1 G-protein coupled receptor 4-like [Poeciliopsis prolifica]